MWKQVFLCRWQNPTLLFESVFRNLVARSRFRDTSPAPWNRFHRHEPANVVKTAAFGWLLSSVFFALTFVHQNWLQHLKCNELAIETYHKRPVMQLQLLTDELTPFLCSLFPWAEENLGTAHRSVTRALLCQVTKAVRKICLQIYSCYIFIQLNPCAFSDEK